MNFTPKKFLGGLVLATFVDTYQEWHAFVNGFCEVLCPWPPRVRIPLASAAQRKDKDDKDLTSEILSEYHYYAFGRALGVIAWLIIAKIIKEAFF
jgi:hypothetical protein